MIKKIFMCTSGLVAGVLILALIGFLLVGAAKSFDNSLSTSVSDGYATCPVSAMEVGYALNTPPKTKFAKVVCGEGEWEWAWLSSSRHDEWQQPQELLDATRVGDLFTCERYRRKSFSGWQEYIFYKRCTKR